MRLSWEDTLYINPIEEGFSTYGSEANTKKLKDLVGDYIKADDLKNYEGKCLVKDYYNSISSDYSYDLRMSNDELRCTQLCFCGVHYEANNCKLMYRLFNNQTLFLYNQSTFKKENEIRDCLEDAEKTNKISRSFINQMLSKMGDWHGEKKIIKSINYGSDSNNTRYAKFHVNYSDLDKTITDIYFEKKDDAFHSERAEYEELKNFEGRILISHKTDDSENIRNIDEVTLYRVNKIDRSGIKFEKINFFKKEGGDVGVIFEAKTSSMLIGELLEDKRELNTFYNNLSCAVINFIERKDSSFLESFIEK